MAKKNVVLKDPCRECPWKICSAPGWLGAMSPGEFVELSDSGQRMPCHMYVDYEQPEEDWRADAEEAPECAGRAIFQANRCQLPKGTLKLPPNRELVFTRPHEFVAHHLRVDPKSLEHLLFYQLYKL